MTTSLHQFITRELEADVSADIAAVARVIVERLNGAAILFYGSVMRTGDLEGLLDFYVLTDGAHGSGITGLASRWLWPDISFEEVQLGNRRVRAKVATMPLERFESAAGGQLLDTTIWTRFVQPSVLIWAARASVSRRVIDAVASAAVTAARIAAAIGPIKGTPQAFWKALFRETYRAEIRVERPGREDQILAYDPARYDRLLRLAWEAGEVRFDQEGMTLTPRMTIEDCHHIVETWLIRQRAGRMLNAARLIKGAFLLEGAARYAVWKVQRHTGARITLTQWGERHPLLAAPRLLWQMWRTTGTQR